MPKFYFELRRHLNLSGCLFEIIFVNDGSTDNTQNTIKRLATKDDRIKHICFDKNYGQQAAIYEGLMYCTGEAAIVLDCDLQDPPYLILEMIEQWRDGADVVLPIRKNRKDRPFKIISANLFYWLLNRVSKTTLDPRIGEFYLLDRKAINQIINKRQPSIFLRGEVQKLNLKKSNIFYDRQSRQRGKGGYSLAKMTRLGHDALRFANHINTFKPRANISESNMLNKKIAIIGAGITGLICAYRLSKLGYTVTVFEKEPQIGGLLSTFNMDGTKIDRHYHHIFTNQQNIINLFNELKISDRLEKIPASMACLKSKTIYSFNNAFDLLKLPHFSLVQKMIMGAGNLVFKLIDPAKHNNKTAKKLIEAKLGKTVWNIFWQPVFEGKFGHYSKKISASWFISRVKSRDKKSQIETLIYPKGGFGILIEKLARDIVGNGGRIITCHNVNSIKKSKQGIKIDGERFDYCISTLAPNESSRIYPSYRQRGIEYLGFVGVIIKANTSLSKHYWITVLDNNAPFGVIVEQNNLLPLSKEKIIYLGKYCSLKSDLYQTDDNKIKEIALDWINSLAPNFSDSINNVKVVKDKYAQPVIKNNYKIPPIKAPMGEFFVLSMAHIFPEDRGIENAVIQSNNIINELLRDTKKSPVDSYKRVKDSK